MEKKWVVKDPVNLALKKKFPEIPGLILQLLVNRGISTQKDIDLFLTPDYGQDLLDPFLFPDMIKAVKRIYQAIENKEIIAIHGDYDADGVTATVLLADVLSQLKADFIVYIPHRQKEGYGLNKETVKYLAKKKVKLIITVDCGISNVPEIELAKDKGIEVIITDHHHEPPQLPAAYAIINPKVESCRYGFTDLAGVGVAYKLAQALITTQPAKFSPGYEKWLLDLVAIGTVTDVMPLLGENRILVKYGLIVLNKSRRKGLKLLAEKAGILPVTETELINSENIGYSLGPRINAAGRMDHASAAYNLLMADNYAEAKELVDNLEKSNQQRQRLTEKIMAEVREQIKDNKDDLIIAQGKDWPFGVIGLVAGRIKDEFNRPIIIISKMDNKIIGSARSIEEFNMIETLDQLAVYFTVYGGHPGAAGFTLKNSRVVADFKKDILKISQRLLKGKDFRPKLLIDAQLDLVDLNWDLFDQIEKFEPFGTANPKPVFLISKAKVDSIRTVGQDNKHLKLLLKQEQVVKGFEAIGFNMGSKVEEIKFNDLVNVVCEINLNEFNGTRKLELRLLDIKKTKN